MSHISDEMARLLTTRELVKIHDRHRRTVGIAGPSSALASQQVLNVSRPLLGWAVLDFQLDPSGEVEDAYSPLELVWILMQRFQNDTLRATLDHHRYRLLFPTGTSLAWPGRPLDEWCPPSPEQRAAWTADPTVVPLSPPRISPPHTSPPQSQMVTLNLSWA